MNSFKRVAAAHIPNKTKHLLDAKSRTLSEPGLKDSFIVSVVLLAPSKRVRPSMRERAALLAVALGATVALTTGSSSTGSGFGGRLINPVSNNQSAVNSEDDSWYQPPRSPGFDSDLPG
jgi:hypothetical protein